MFVDLRTSDDLRIVEADVCIVGAGPAGIAIAHEFDGMPTRVCVVESGDFKADERAQDLADAEMVGCHPQIDLRSQRDRRFGGSTNSWAGACAPMSASDFEDRAGIDLEGWPFARDELDPYYERAHGPLKLGPYRYDRKSWEADNIRFLDFDAKALENRLWQLSPRVNLGETHRTSFAASNNITVLLNATATEILTDEQARIAKGVALRTLDGKSAVVDATWVIVACGGIDNARLLLLSRRHMPAGLGNGHDLVGRYFMQHPHVSAASFRRTGSKTWIRNYKDFRRDSLWLRARIGLSEAAQRREGALNSVATLINRYITDDLTHSQSIGYVSIKAVLLDLRHGRVPVNFASRLASIVKDVRGIAIGCIRQLRDQNGAIYVMSEQFPNPESRVNLSQKKDALGLEKAEVDWRLLPIDKRSILALVETIKSEFARLGIAEVRPDAWLTVDDHSWPDTLAGGNHHMGSTRMSDSPATGVVDADARVHGMENLYIAGSSIFPTVGCANPTLTVMATSLKLADHLKARIAQQRTPTLVA